MIYLGASLAQDGHIHAEVSRQMGAARAEFQALQRVWAHASLPMLEKVRIFEACVVAPLTYGLQTAWLLRVIRRRLDGFQAKCLRRICRILPSFLSHVSNADVRARAGSQRLSTSVRMQQLMLAGRYMASPEDAPARVAMLRIAGGHLLAGVRRQGRPRTTWAADVLAEAVALADSEDQLRAFAAQPALWRRAVSAHCAARYEP